MAPRMGVAVIAGLASYALEAAETRVVEVLGFPVEEAGGEGGASR